MAFVDQTVGDWQIVGLRVDGGTEHPEGAFIKPATYGYNQHGGFFKFAVPDPGDAVGDGTPPRLYVHDSVFRSDERAAYRGYDTSYGYLGIPANATCHDVVIIGWETRTAAEVASWESRCTNLAKGTLADWDEAVQTWEETHPPLVP